MKVKCCEVENQGYFDCSHSSHGLKPVGFLLAVSMKNQNDIEHFDMVCLRASESDLEYDVWLYSSGNEHEGTLMIKADVGGNLIPIVLTSKDDIRALKPFEFSNQMVLWAKNNYETLLNHWYGWLSDRQVLNMLAKPL